MTDYDKFKNLLDEIKCEYEIYKGNICLEEGMNKVEGYIGFSTHICFDKNKKFKEFQIGEG